MVSLYYLATYDGLETKAQFPVNVILAINHSVFVKGDHTDFEIEPSFRVEASEEYPDVKCTLWKSTSTSFPETSRRRDVTFFSSISVCVMSRAFSISNPMVLEKAMFLARDNLQDYSHNKIDINLIRYRACQAREKNYSCRRENK